MAKKTFRFNWQLYLGVVLVVAGGLFLADQLLPISIMAHFWPLLIIFLGVTFYIGMLAAGRDGSGLAIPGTIVTTIGLLLFVQNAFNLWVTWSYAWTLLICATGLGILIMNLYLKRDGLRRVAGLLIGIGLTLFVIFGLFFEIILNISGADIYSGIFLGGGLILLGLFIVFNRALFNRAKPDFHSADSDEPGTMEGDYETVEKPMSKPTQTAVDFLPEGATFSSLRFKSFGKVILKQGDACDLKIDGSEEQLERLRVDMEGDTLVIRFDSGAGAAQVWAEATLNAVLTGAGSINYKGQHELTQSKSGIGEIKAI